jgi:hypothetical protein
MITGKEKWAYKDPQEIYQDLISRFEFHKCNAEAGVRSACRWSWVMALLIPIVSATVTFLSADFGIPLPGWIAPLAGLVLTMLAIFNAVTRQDHRYSTLARQLIALNDWKFGLDLDIANKLTSGGKKEDMHRLLKEKNTRLSQIGREMAAVFAPKRPE